VSAPLLLFIESSSTVCSVALAENGIIIAKREQNEGYTHAESLHVFVKEMMQETDKNFQQINAVAISTGPGSYTGLRIGMSAAKGFCFALGIPLIGVSTLENLVIGAMRNMHQSTCKFFIPLIDARRMEVYHGIYDSELKIINAPSPLIITPESIKYFEQFTPAAFFGSGMNKCKSILTDFTSSYFLEDILPSATNMIEIGFKKFASGDFLDLAYCEPDYLKEFHDTRKF
jgi:tRNA threonylcarbamoyladenosine biosynthesis protein TsaB